MYGKILLSLSVLAIANSAHSEACYAKKGCASIWLAPVVRYQSSKANEIKSSIDGKSIAGVELSRDEELKFEQTKNLGYFAGRAGLSVSYKMWKQAAIGWEIFADLGKREAWLNDISDENKTTSENTSSSTGNGGTSATPVTSSAGTQSIAGTKDATNHLKLSHYFAGYTGVFASYYAMDNMRLNGGIGAMMHNTKFTYGGKDLAEVKTKMQYSFGGYLKLGADWLINETFFVGAEVTGQLRANKDIKIADVTFAKGGDKAELSFKRKEAFGFNGAIRFGLDMFKFG
ncbi:hypothetical protein FZC35_00725 [Candidatus Cytomitobacter indipagum]|uniref:Outer membrane beta-barrel protein n=1 Tax=Candidatus Cytomitobacter indipagum TaxID=2601575 RepID=A0A5C0UDY1_9PROT|nr:hypothetical protein FZC35_00725 [Candidatus Cytomitobacter indipagum]